MYARPVAAGRRKPVERPRNPRGDGLRSGERFEPRVVFLLERRDRFCRQRRHVPSPTHHGDFVEGPLRLANRASHPRFSQRFVGLPARNRFVSYWWRRLTLAQCRHRFGDRGEHVCIGLPPMLERVLPPSLAVIEPGGVRQFVERIEPKSRGFEGSFRL